jgi:hypothetical protein
MGSESELQDTSKSRSNTDIGIDLGESMLFYEVYKVYDFER